MVVPMSTTEGYNTTTLHAYGNDVTRFHDLVTISSYIIAPIGIIFNILALIVWVIIRKQTPIYPLLVLLSICDCVSLVCSLYAKNYQQTFEMFYSLPQKYTVKFIEFPDSYFHYYGIDSKFTVRFLRLTMEYCSFLVTLAVGITRFIAISRPLKAKTFVTTNLCVWFGLGSLIISVICKLAITFSGALFFPTVERWSIAVRCIIVFFYGVPWFVMLVVNAGMLIHICKANKTGRSLNTNQDDIGNKLTITVSLMTLCSLLVFPVRAISLAYVVSVPVSGNQVMDAGQQYAAAKSIIDNITGPTEVVSRVNSSVNLLFYCALGTMFRNVLFGLGRRREEAASAINPEQRISTII
ncbi:hypothetical protein SNE40_017431 [Patella caerulea]|uniref:G-protein coupled receptors family 1 profile domain-containing protein n=2 Tax=Patella caerulea TaxID=87958 RepID=A0AAN8JAF5_PATCE